MARDFGALVQGRTDREAFDGAFGRGVKNSDKVIMGQNFTPARGILDKTLPKGLQNCPRTAL